MNSIIYIVGLVVVVGAVLAFFGLRRRFDRAGDPGRLHGWDRPNVAIKVTFCR